MYSLCPYELKRHLGNTIVWIQKEPLDQSLRLDLLTVGSGVHNQSRRRIHMDKKIEVHMLELKGPSKGMNFHTSIPTWMMWQATIMHTVR